MDRLETIHVRLAGASPEGLLAELRESILAEPGVASVHVYRRATVPTDVGIHIRLEPGSGPPPSALGLRLADALSEHGMVRHAVWLEEGEEAGS